MTQQTSALSRPTPALRQATRSRGLMLVGVYKLVHAALLLAVAVAALRVLHGDAQAHLLALIRRVHLSPTGAIAHLLLSRARAITPQTLVLLGALLGFYTLLLLVEGIGLLLGRRWAEYLTLVSTGLFVPLELYELLVHPTLLKGALLVANLVVLGYLALRVRAAMRT